MRSRKINYRGFSIEDEGGLFAVRFYQTLSGKPVMNDYKPWCNSVEKARQVVDKIIFRCEIAALVEKYGPEMVSRELLNLIGDEVATYARTTR
jgi:hypothetical protein